MSARLRISDPGRPDDTPHERLSTSIAASAPLALVSAPPATFQVTTLDDVVDANDGVLSLREAITAANAASGLDTITFADAIRGGTIALTADLPTITDDLVIDGDPADLGPGGIVIDGSGGPMQDDGFVGFRLDGVTARFEDLTIVKASVLGIETTNSDLTITRADIVDFNEAGGIAPSVGIDATGGTVTVVDSTIGYGGGDLAAGIVIEGTSLEVRDSRIVNNRGDYGYGIRGSGDVVVTNSTIADNGGPVGAGIDVVGNIVVENSTLLGNGSGDSRRTGSAILADGTLQLINSTIAGTRTADVQIYGAAAAAVGLEAGSTASIVNSTLTGSYLYASLYTPAVGLYVGPGARATIANSIIDDTIQGTIASNGANTFRDAAVDGALPSDRLGVSATDLFSALVVGGGGSLISGFPADNGGPTLTIALFDDPANPALDAANPADAPPTDQRGFARDATPDIGAFEFGTTPPPVVPGDEGLIVTTLADEIVANGLVSLREAVLTANALPGPNTITFADDLRGGTIKLQGKLPTITDDLVIDGDPADGGPGGIVIDGSGGPLQDDGFIGFELDGVAARFEDLTIENAYLFGILTTNSDLEVTRTNIVEINDSIFGGSRGIAARGGTVTVVDSTIGYGEGNIAAGIIIYGTAVEVRDSRIINNRGEYGFGIIGEGQVRVVDSAISDNGANRGFGIAIEGDLLIESSTLARNGTEIGLDGSGAVLIDGALVIVNSTIADSASGETTFPFPSGAVTVLGRSTASIVNSTITGTGVGFTDEGSRETYGVGIGILAPPTSVVDVRNSIVDDTVFGTITSNGANTFRDVQVGGATGNDRLGVTADDLFALTKDVPDSLFSGSGGVVRAGVLADNGGPTQTVALLNDPANPALDAANPADAPPTDQRGFARDATPDIGSFEVDGGPPSEVPALPVLAEKVPLDDAEIVGVSRGQLTLTGGDAAISFVDEFAAFQNSLGVYLVGAGSEIVGPRWVFPEVEHALASDLASKEARPGGGPLSPGKEVLLSDLFDPAELAPGVEFGLFLVADGWSLNPQGVFEAGTLAFRSGGDTASVTDRAPELVHIAANGVERLVLGDIMHTVDAGSPNPLSNTLNPTGAGQATSGLLDGLFTVAFEDKPLQQSDRDFNDALFAIDLLDGATEVAGAVTAATTAGSGAVAVQALLTEAEVA